MTVRELYTLTMQAQQRRLVVIFVLAFAVFLLAGLPMSFRSGQVIVIGFIALWTFGAGPLLYRVLRGPTRIDILLGQRVRLVNWFGQEHELAFGEIDAIEVESGLLTIVTPQRTYLTMNGFDGLHRFVHDVASHNRAFVTKGI